MAGKIQEAMRRKEKKNNHKNSGHFVLQTRQRAVHTLRLDKNCFIGHW